MFRSSFNAQPLTNDQLARYAPAVFATAPHAKLSERYSLLRTIDVIDALRGAGWAPFKAAESYVRDATRSGLQRHAIRLRHADAANQLRNVGDVIAELVLENSHDGSSAYQLHAGLFRLACSNGLVVADATFAKVSIRHVGITTAEVVEGAQTLIRDIPKLGESVSAMRSVQLSAGEQEAFAAAASTVRWDDAPPVEPRALLQARRSEDRSSDLWTTMNRVQENIVRGGVRGRSTTGRRMSTRAIGSVGEDTRINKAIWQLAEEMRKLKAA